MSKFSDNLKNLRIRFNLTQQDLAKKLGVSKSTVSMYETGNRTPDFETLEAIADLFNVSLDTLIGSHSKPDAEIHVIAAHALSNLDEDQIKKVIEFAKFIKMTENDKE